MQLKGNAVDVERYRAAEQRLFADAEISPVERWIVLPGDVRTRVLDHGEGEPTLFLHGGPNAAAIWTYVAAATSGLRCLLLDRPGCGLSDPPAAIPSPPSVRNHLSQLSVDVLDALELPAASLVGSSAGGYGAIVTAARHPDRIKRLALVGCPAFAPGATRTPAFVRIMLTPLLGQLLAAMPPSNATVRASLRQMGHRDTLRADRIPDAMLEWMLAWQRDTDTMRNETATVRATATWLNGFDAELDLTPGELRAVTAPCLILSGTADPFAGKDVIEELANAMPSATADYLDDAGHLPFLDDSNWIATRIDRFLTTDS